MHNSANQFSLACLLTCIFVSGNAQIMDKEYARYQSVYYPTLAYDLPVKYEKAANYISEKRIDRVTITKLEINKKGKTKSWKYYQTYYFNKDGQPIKMQGGKKGKSASYEYKLTQGVEDYKKRIYLKNGKLHSTEEMYEDRRNGYARKTIYLDKNNDTSGLIILNNIDTTTLMSEDFYYKKGKLKYKWVNEYYPNKSKKKTSVYKRGKLQYVWDYQCKDEGIEIAKHKDTSTVCISREYDSDSVLTVVSQSVDDKGKLTKTVSRRNKYYKTLSSKTYHGSEDKLSTSWYQTFAQDTILTSSRFEKYKNGIKTYASISTYAKNGDLISKTKENYKKKTGELTSKNEVTYVYDDLTRPSRMITTNVITGAKKITLFNYE